MSVAYHGSGVLGCHAFGDGRHDAVVEWHLASCPRHFICVLSRVA